MPARLTLHVPHRPARNFILYEGREYVLGRGRDCDLEIDDDRISRRHALFAADPAGGWRLTDLDSKNGIAVGGTAVAGAAELAGRSWLSFGGLLARFEPLTADAAERQSQLAEERWRTSVELGRQFDPGLGLEGLLARLVESVLGVSGAERGFVVLARPDGELEIAAARGVTWAELAERDFSGSVGAVERALAEGRSVVAGDAAADADLGERPSVVAGGIRALVSVPLPSPGGILGVIYADSRRPGAVFTELDVEILEALASHAGLAVAVARLHEELEGLAAGLTAGADLPPATGERLRADLELALGRAWQRSLGGAGGSVRELRAAARAADGGGRPTWSEVTAVHRGAGGVGGAVR